MKHLLLTISIVFLGLPMLAQDIHFPSAIVAAGGSSEGGSLMLKSWRLAPVYVITLSESLLEEADLDNKVDWKLKLYPNPVVDILNIEITPSDTGQIVIELYNSVGMKMLIEKYSLQPVIQLDVSEILPGPYLLKAFSTSNEMIYEIKRVIKR